MTHKQHLKNLLAGGKTGQAIKELREATAQNGQDDLHNSLLLLSSRYNRNENANASGVLLHEHYALESNRIENALKSYISEYNDNGTYQLVPTSDASTPKELTTDKPIGGNTHRVTGSGNIVITGVNGSNVNINTGEKKLPDAPKEKPQTILFLAANPTSAASLQTDKEYRIIKAELERGKHREKYRFLLPQLSLTITELLRAMNEKPDIVHFSGHGTKDGIVLVKDDNTHQVMPTVALQRLFKNAKGYTKIALLNACYSAEQAKVISTFGITVIGNNLPIGDDAAISFAKGLYNGLSEGKDIESAYNDAIIVLLTENASYANVVEVWQNGEKMDW